MSIRTLLIAMAVLLGASGCGAPGITTGATLAVVDVNPTDGAIDVSPNQVVSVCFSAPVLSDDATPEIFEISTADGEVESGLLVSLASEDPHCVRIAHPTLAGAVAYVVRVEPGLRAAEGGGSLPVALESRFRTGSASP